MAARSDDSASIATPLVAAVLAGGPQRQREEHDNADHGEDGGDDEEGDHSFLLPKPLVADSDVLRRGEAIGTLGAWTTTRPRR